MGGIRHEMYLHTQDYLNILRKRQVKLLKEEQTEFVQGQLDIVEQDICDIEFIEQKAKES